jgi:hypothetical protein
MAILIRTPVYIQSYVFSWHYCFWWTLASSKLLLSFQFQKLLNGMCFFNWVGLSAPRRPHSPTTWRTRVSLFVWVIITFHLSDMRDPPSSYVTSSIALRVIRPHKLQHCIKVGICSGCKHPIRPRYYITGLKIHTTAYYILLIFQ